MIELKTTVIGDKQIAKAFEDARASLRPEIDTELAAIGEDVVKEAAARVSKRTGRTAGRIIYRLGRETKLGFQRDESVARLTVLPGEPTAHLIERGVDATISRRRNRSRDVVAIVGRRSRRFKRIAVGISFLKPYRLSIPPRPYFIPAVQSIGDVGARLQAAIARVAARAQGAA